MHELLAGFGFDRGFTRIKQQIAFDVDQNSIFDAFGLYNGTETLSTSQVQSAAGEDADGYSSSWTVPFAARAYFEVQKCAAADGCRFYRIHGLLIT